MQDGMVSLRCMEYCIHRYVATGVERRKVEKPHAQAVETHGAGSNYHTAKRKSPCTLVRLTTLAHAANDTRPRGPRHRS